MRYFLVELLTGLTFLVTWFTFGHQSIGLVLAYDLFLAGLLVATFIDFEHFIIPDEITIGGMATGFICSMLVPQLHDGRMTGSMRQSLVGMAVGAGLIYTILRLGKLLFGRHRLSLPAGSKVIFTETALLLPDKEIPYEELFYRASDVIAVRATTLELVDRCYKNALVRLSPDKLRIEDEEIAPEAVPHMEAVSEEIVLPREAMGFGDVKFMGAIGAFLGWQAVLFSLMVSSIIGSFVGLGLILLGKREWSSRLPYGPYIALAAAIWVFGGKQFVEWWFVTHPLGPQ